MFYSIFRTNEFVFKRMAEMAEQIEHLVDIRNDRQTVIHTYPISVSSDNIPVTEDQIKDKAIKAAKFSRLVPGDEAGTLTAEMHVSRSGQLQPYGNKLPNSAETIDAIKSDISDRAYFLWQNNGSQEEKADYYWKLGEEEHFRIRAYALWEQEGKPENRDKYFWYEAQNFERDAM
jgi:hypothetical protein